MRKIKKLGYVIFMSIVLASPSILGSAALKMTDPTEYDESSSYRLSLQAIAFRDQEYFCVINDVVHTIGDLVYEYIITEISDNEVFLQNEENEVKKLTLY